MMEIGIGVAVFCFKHFIMSWRRALLVASVTADWTKTDFAFRSRAVTLLRVVVNCCQLLLDLSVR